MNTSIKLILTVWVFTIIEDAGTGRVVGLTDRRGDFLGGLPPCVSLVQSLLGIYFRLMYSGME